MLQLIIKDIEDKFSRENFFRLERFIKEQQILSGEWNFFTVDIPAASDSFIVPHKLSFVPRDIILLSAKGDQNFYFKYASFDSQNIYVKTNGPVVLRFLAGSFLDQSYGNITKDYPLVPPTYIASPGLATKSGVVSAGSFAGTPKKYTVTFATPFPDTNYAVSIAGMDGRTFTYESKTTNGFVINTGAGAALVDEVSWTAVATGET